MKVKYEVGYDFPRGRQSNFAPYGQYTPIGDIGVGPVYEQPKRYPLPYSTKVTQTALSNEFLLSTMTAINHLGLADPGLYNSKALSQPLGNDPAVRAQQMVLRPRPSDSREVQRLLSSMSVYTER